MLVAHKYHGGRSKAAGIIFVHYLSCQPTSEKRRWKILPSEFFLDTILWTLQKVDDVIPFCRMGFRSFEIIKEQNGAFVSTEKSFGMMSPTQSFTYIEQSMKGSFSRSPCFLANGVNKSMPWPICFQTSLIKTHMDPQLRVNGHD